MRARLTHTHTHTMIVNMCVDWYIYIVPKVERQRHDHGCLFFRGDISKLNEKCT